jgi:hypothetical protein
MNTPIKPFIAPLVSQSELALALRHVEDMQIKDIKNDQNISSLAASNSDSQDSKTKKNSHPVKTETKGNVISLDFRNKKLKHLIFSRKFLSQFTFGN